MPLPFALPALSGLLSWVLGSAVRGALSQIADAAMAILRGIIQIVTDLAKTFEGRIVLGLIAGGLAAWYVTQTYTIVRKHEVQACIAKPAAQMERRTPTRRPPAENWPGR